jgi:uncharacterized protein YuzE
MEISYDSEVDVMKLVLFKDRVIVESEPSASNPNVIIDFDKNNNPVAIEILHLKQLSGGIDDYLKELSILSVSVSDLEITAEISDGRRVSIPIAWFPRLLNATESQRNNFKLISLGAGIHWPDVDEDISVRAFVG